MPVSEQLNLIQRDLNTNLLDEIQKVALLPDLEKMWVEIKGQKIGLKARLSIIPDDAKQVKNLSQIESNLSSIKNAKAVWRSVYHKCIEAQLYLLSKACIDTERNFTNNSQQSPEITRNQYQALKKIKHELTLLSFNAHLNDTEKRTIESFQSDVQRLLPSLQTQMNNDLDKALVVIDKPFVQELDSSSIANIGQFTHCSNEILLHLLSVLLIKDLSRLSRCNKFFRNLCENDFIWQKILQQEFPSIEIPANKSAKQIYMSQKATTNLKNGLYTCTTWTHIDFDSCFQKDGDLLFSGSLSNTIRIWNFSDLKKIQCIATLRGHLGSIKCLQKEGNYLFSGSWDTTIKVWNLSDLKKARCIATLTQHLSSVDWLQKEGNYLFSSADKTIKVWDLSDLKKIQCIATLTEHKNSIDCLQKEGNYLFSAAWDIIKVWDLRNLNKIQCIVTFKTYQWGGVRCLYRENNLLFSGSWGDGTIKIWNLADLNNIQCTAILKGHENYVQCLLKVDNLLFSGSRDCAIKVWDLNTNQCIATLNDHEDAVVYIAKEGNLLFSGSNDSTLKAWDFLNIPSENTLLKKIKTISKKINERKLQLEGFFSSKSWFY